MDALRFYKGLRALGFGGVYRELSTISGISFKFPVVEGVLRYGVHENRGILPG